MSLSHFNPDGSARMVDVGSKPVTRRVARASGRVKLQPATLETIQSRQISKGDVLEVARLAGIMATKQTAQLIPLCHSLGLNKAEVRFRINAPDEIQIEAVVENEGRTGVEMEALVAVSTAALTIYDMCKSIDRDMQIDTIQLEEKLGGQSGHYLRHQPEEPA